MVVTARAARRQAQEYSRVGFHAVHDVLHRVLLRNDAVLGIGAMVAIESGRHFLLERRVGKHIAGNLIAREVIERKIAVEGVDHPVAPSPHHALAVELITVCVRVTAASSQRKAMPSP